MKELREAAEAENNKDDRPQDATEEPTTTVVDEVTIPEPVEEPEAAETSDCAPISELVPQTGPPVVEPTLMKSSEVEAAAQKDTPDVPIWFAEKKRLNWTGKTC